MTSRQYPSLFRLWFYLITAAAFRVKINVEDSSALRCQRKAGLTAGGSIAENRKASHDYEFEERFIAGVVLFGTEAKTCRSGNVQISDGLAEIRDGECW